MAAPIPVDLPGLPALHFWTPSQWSTYFSLIEAIIPSIVTPSGLTDKAGQVRISDEGFAEAYARILTAVAHPPSEADFRAYLEWSPATDPRFAENCQRSLATVPPGALKRLGGVLNLLG